MRLRRTILTNGKIVTEDCVLLDHDLVLCDGVIDRIAPRSTFPKECSEIIDCLGRYILPGLIDLHSDMIESIIVPRKGIVFDPVTALFEADRQLISQGITTMYHSISIANSTICDRKRTLSVQEMIGIGDTIYRYQNELLIHHRFHARLELNTLEAYDDILSRIEQGRIHELSLMDHTPGQGQYASLDAFKVEIKKQYGEIPDSRMEDIIRTCQAKPLLSPLQIQTLLKLATSKDIPTAFHDLETPKDLKFMRDLEINIAEFPLNEDIALEAARIGLNSLVGAPNILKGGSHNKNVSAIDLLTKGLATIICSDYYTPSLLSAIFLLPQISQITLPEAVCFATRNPAQAVHLSNGYGSITPGKKADLIVVDTNGPVPKVITSIIDGIKKYEVSYEGK